MMELRTRIRCLLLALTLLPVAATGAPLPPARPKPPPPPPVSHDECAGAWCVRAGASVWYVTLYPGGQYRANADRDAHDFHLPGGYVGEWRLNGGELQIAERSVNAAPDQCFTECGGAVGRDGSNLKVGGHSWMAGKWARR